MGGTLYTLSGEVEYYVSGNDQFKDELEDMLQGRVAPGKSGRPAKENETELY